MFTGIIEEMGEVVALTQPTDRDARLVIRAPQAADSQVGASVAVNGVCLTVLESPATSRHSAALEEGAQDLESQGLLAFDIMPQTLKLTGLGELKPGDAVNVERAMLATSRFDGHVVQGHVDGRATLLSREPGGGGYADGQVAPAGQTPAAQRWDTLRFQLAPELLRYLAPQGSITVDGVSLTVSDLHDDGFSVSLIPTTLAVTTLGQLQPGAQVNIETDALAKYAAQLNRFAPNPSVAQNLESSPRHSAARAAGAQNLESVQHFFSPNTVTQVAEANQPTAWGTFRIHAFRDSHGIEHVALVNLPAGAEGEAPLVRVHSECLTGDAFGSLRCDCGPQLHAAMELVAQNGGAVVYLRGQEGRGIGLAAKIAAYALQDQGLDTVDANEQLGLPVDARDYSAAVEILKALGLTRVNLLTNNPAKVEALAAHGIEIENRVPLEVGVNSINEFYLETKRDRMHHQLHLAQPHPLA